MKRVWLSVLFVILFGWGLPLAAQEFNGSLETRLGWYWSAPDLISLPQSFVAKVSGTIGDPDQPAAQYAARLKVDYDPATASASLALGEAWLKLIAGPFDLSFGNQVLAWGSTDVFTPSDVVNPRDLGLPVDPVKIPVTLARLVYNGSVLSIDLVAQPFWVASVIPGSRWTVVPALPVTPPPPMGLTWANMAYGGRLQASLGLLQGLDLGLTAYHGRSPTTTATILFTGPIPTGLALTYDPFTLLAFDATLAPGGSLVLRTEWGYKTLRDSNPFEPEAAAASLQGVSGLEFRLGQVQVIAEHVLDWAKDPAGAGDTLEHSVVAILSWEGGGRASLKAAAIYKFDGGGTIVPQFSYTLADGLKLDCGLYFFFGATDSTYGAWKDNSLGKVSLSYSF
jgi:hypothetical protein